MRSFMCTVSPSTRKTCVSGACTWSISWPMPGISVANPRSAGRTSQQLDDERVAGLGAAHGDRPGRRVDALEVDRRHEIGLGLDLPGEAVVRLERDDRARLDLEHGLHVGPNAQTTSSRPILVRSFERHPSSVPEVPAAGEDHRRAGRVDGLDHLGVAARAARLDQAVDARVERELRARRRTGRTRRSRATAPARSWPCSRAFSIAIRTESTRLIWPAPIPIVCRSLREHDRVRRDVLADAPGEEQVAPLRLGRARRRRRCIAVAVVDVDVAVLHEQAAEDALVVALAGRLAAALVVARGCAAPASRGAPRSPPSS